MYLISKFSAYDSAYEDTTESGKPGGANKRSESKVLINRTRPQPCDQYVELYQLTLKPKMTNDKAKPYDKKRSGTNNNRYDAKCTRYYYIL